MRIAGDRINGSIKPNCKRSIEFVDWETPADIPDDFKKENKYRLNTANYT